MSRVDIVVPCYNYGRYLRQCIDSLLTQEGVDVRVLIIDDCSTDDSPEIARAIAAEDSRVEFRRHEKNLGHIATYNEGLLGWVTAEYCLLISADDLLTPGALKTAAMALDQNRTAGLCYGKAVLFQDAVPTQLDHVAESLPFVVIPGSQLIEFAAANGCNPVPTPTAIVRTSLLHKIGGYDPELPHSGDLEMWLRIAANADVAISSQVFGCYRRHPHNMSGGYNRTFLRDMAERLAAFEKVFDRYSAEIPQIPRYSDLVRASLAEESLRHAENAALSGHLRDTRNCLQFARSTHRRIRTRQGWGRVALKAICFSIASQLRSIARARQTDASIVVKPESYVGRLIGWYPTSLRSVENSASA